jgi:antitoxin StbD
MSYEILSNIVTNISELKKNPMSVIKSGQGEPVAILNHNKPVGYFIPSKIYEVMLDIIDDINLAKIVEERSKEKAIDCNIDDL